MMDPGQFEAFAQTHSDVQSLFSDLMEACDNMLKSELYPDEWLVLKMFEFSVLEKVLEVLKFVFWDTQMHTTF